MAGKLGAVTSARELFDFAEVVADEFDRDISLAALLIFFCIASAGDLGIDQAEVVKRVKMSPSAVSRNIRNLSRVGSDKEREGFDVVEFTFDPSDNRRRIIKINQKGEKIIAKLRAAI